jgi:GntR family transcriptional regulator / MocR family aminotransferase
LQKFIGPAGPLVIGRSRILIHPVSTADEVNVGSWEFAMELDRRGAAPLSRQIARTVSEDIQRGRLRPGDRLPGSRTLANTLRVNRQTVVTAIDDLVAEGWLVSRKTAGIFVADGLPESSAGRARAVQRIPGEMSRRFALELSTAPEPELPSDLDASTLLLSGSRPDMRLVPGDLIGRYYRRVVSASGRMLLSYNHPAGSPRLRQQLAMMLSVTRGLVVEPESIMVTRGSQMALVLLARALIRPGDTVAVEHPGYRPAWEAFKLAGAAVTPIPVDERGLDVQALAQLISRRPIRAVYVTPHHQFPTTVTLAGPRRLRLLELARRERFAVIEDDYDHEFHYSGNPVLPLASIDRTGIVSYVGTLSKVLAPGLRIGFIAAPPDFIQRVAAYRSIIDLQGDHALEAAIADLFEEGLIQRHVRRIRRVYSARLDTMAAALRRHLGDFVTFSEPSGGTAIWVRVRSARIMAQWARASRERGVSFETGPAFTLTGKSPPAARVGFACLSEVEIERAVQILAVAARRVRR